MEKINLISVVIPTFNRASTIKGAIDSVLNQTYQNIEIIIVDDGSDDDTEEIINALNNHKIVYYKLDKNMGANLARNYGISNAKGDVIAFQDSDDVWHREKLEKQVNTMNEVNADVVFCAMEVSQDTKKKVIPNKRLKSQFISFNKILMGSLASTQTLLVKKKCFKDTEFDPKISRLQDWDLVIRLTEKYSVYYLQEVLVDVFIQNDSISMDSSKGYKSLKMIESKHKDYINNNKKIRAYFSSVLAKFSDDREIADKYYRDSLKFSFRIKVFIKYILFLLKLY